MQQLYYFPIVIPPSGAGGPTWRPVIFFYFPLHQISDAGMRIEKANQ